MPRAKAHTHTRISSSLSASVLQRCNAQASPGQDSNRCTLDLVAESVFYPLSDWLHCISFPSAACKHNKDAFSVSFFETALLSHSYIFRSVNTDAPANKKRKKKEEKKRGGRVTDAFSRLHFAFFAVQHLVPRRSSSALHLDKHVVVGN